MIGIITVVLPKLCEGRIHSQSQSQKPFSTAVGAEDYFRHCTLIFKIYNKTN